MAQSIPPNLEGGNSLTWKARLKTRVIYKRKRNKKEIFHISKGSIKTKMLSVTSKWHIKSTLCKTSNIPKENTMSIKNTCHDQNKTKKNRCPTTLMARHPEVVEDILESDVTCPP